jgi:hypothetical protein
MVEFPAYSVKILLFQVLILKTLINDLCTMQMNKNVLQPSRTDKLLAMVHKTEIYLIKQPSRNWYKIVPLS